MKQQDVQIILDFFEVSLTINHPCHRMLYMAKGMWTPLFLHLLLVWVCFSFVVPKKLKLTATAFSGINGNPDLNPIQHL